MISPQVIAWSLRRKICQTKLLEKNHQVPSIKNAVTTAKWCCKLCSEMKEIDALGWLQSTCIQRKASSIFRLEFFS